MWRSSLHLTVVCSSSTKEIPQGGAPFNRRADIAFEYPSGRVEYDDIVDELPFDINADVVEIGDEDFGLWYLDASDNPKSMWGKLFALQPWSTARISCRKTPLYPAASG